MNKLSLITPGYTQLTVADLGFAHLVWPTCTQYVLKPIGATQVPVAERQYAPKGYLIMEEQLIATVYGLELKAIAPEGSPFKLSRRIGPGIPMSFEAQSAEPLPEALLSQAVFACEFPNQAIPLHAVFRGMKPRQVSVQ